MFRAVGILLVAFVVAQTPDRVKGWHEDLTRLSRTLRSGQYDFAKRYDVAAFDDEIAALDRDAARMTDADLTLRIMKLVARANDGHSHVMLPLFAPFHRLPLTVEWFADGL